MVSLCVSSSILSGSHMIVIVEVTVHECLSLEVYTFYHICDRDCRQCHLEGYGLFYKKNIETYRYLYTCFFILC